MARTRAGALTSTMTIGERFRAHPENAAALVNALVVLLAPVVLLFGGSLLPTLDSDTNVTVRAPGGPAVGEAAAVLMAMFSGLAPAAVVAGWRTRVLARRWLREGRGDWRGVGEAGACGFGIALLVLARGILTRPLEAPPYVIVYGGSALVLGLLVGLILRTSALLVLRALHAQP